MRRKTTISRAAGQALLPGVDLQEMRRPPVPGRLATAKSARPSGAKRRLDRKETPAISKREKRRTGRGPQQPLWELPYREQFVRVLVGEGRWEGLTGEEKRAKAMRWVNGVGTRRNKSGTATNRAARIAMCGQVRLAHNPKTSKWSYAATSCKDAACPRCQASRSKQYAWALGQKVAEGQRLMTTRLITLTKPKVVGESVEDAYKALTKCWVRHRSHKVFRKNVVGGVRTFECVWRVAGEKTPSGYVVRTTGWHVHLHALVQLNLEQALWHGRGNIARGCECVLAYLVEDWLKTCDGAKASAQRPDARPLASVGKAVSYVTKYVTKPFDLPDYKAREFFSTMVGRRWVEGWGEWRDWRKPLREKGEGDGWVMTATTMQELWGAAEKDLKVQVCYRQVLDRFMSNLYGHQLGGTVHRFDVRARDVLRAIVEDSRSVGDHRRGTGTAFRPEFERPPPRYKTLLVISLAMLCDTS